jgi:hypothetical protein
VGSKTFDGVWFIAYPNDHLPPHVHGFYAETEVIVDLLPDGNVAKSRRRRSVKPASARLSDVRRILSVAAARWLELNQLWEDARG